MHVTWQLNLFDGLKINYLLSALVIKRLGYLKVG